MKIKSLAFENFEHIPKEYTCDGYNFSPPLKFENIPDTTKELVLVVDDPDAVGGIFTHWIVWNIKPETREFKKNHASEGVVVGENSERKNKYNGPCPPFGTHVYLFKLYAIDTILPNNPRLGKKEIRALIEGYIIDKAILKGYFERVL